MQPDPLKAVKEFAERYSIPFDDEDAALLVANRLRLAKNTKDEEALRISRHFASRFHFAKDDVSFEDFATQPRCPFDCPECRGHNERYARRMTAYYDAKFGPLVEDL